MVFGMLEGILGATPEILFSYTNSSNPTNRNNGFGQGTLSNNHSVEQLFIDPKIRREHQFVIDDLLSSLNPFGKVKLLKRVL